MRALTCGNGLYFSTKCNCCDVKANVECLLEEDQQTKFINVKEKRVSKESLAEKLHLPTVLSGNVNIKCPTTGSFIYPYHGNSDYYYACLNGQASLRACAEGYHYNDTQKRCVKPEPEIHNGTADFELKIPIDEIELFEVKCPLEGATIMAHSESKEKYILCMNGQPTVFDCAEGLFYNDKLKKCSDYVGEATIYQTSRPGETNYIMCPKFGTSKYPHTNDTHYYLCTDGKVYILACDNDEIFDSEINLCRQKPEIENPVKNIENISDKPRATIVAEFASNIICPKLGTFMFPHSQRNRYYVCVDGHAIGFACADGYIYDSEVNACKADNETLEEDIAAPTLLDEPINILCPSSGASKFPHLARNKFYLCINGMASVLACPQGTLFDAELSNCRAPLEEEQKDDDTLAEDTVTCPKLGTFVYAHSNKTQYNVCLDGQSIVLTCNEGLIFDPKEKICRTSNENKVENIKALVDLKASPIETLKPVEEGTPFGNVKASETQEPHTSQDTELNNKTANGDKTVKTLKIDTTEVAETIDETDSSVSNTTVDGNVNSENQKQVLYAIKYNSSDAIATVKANETAKAENI